MNKYFSNIGEYFSRWRHLLLVTRTCKVIVEARAAPAISLVHARAVVLTLSEVARPFQQVRRAVVTCLFNARHKQ